MENINNIEYKAGFETTTKTGHDIEYRFQIDFYLFKEDGRYISYCPALDLSSSGDSHNEAIANFYEAFQLFVETCVSNNSLLDALKDLGWKIDNVKLTPPSFSFLMKNPEFSCLIEGMVDYERIVSNPLSIHTSCAL